jgi:hypothetical protein
MTTMQLRSKSNKRKRKMPSDALVEFTPAESLDWMERRQVRLRDAMLKNASKAESGDDLSCIEEEIVREKMDLMSDTPFRPESCRAAMDVSRRSGVAKKPQQAAPPKKKVVRFATLVTVRVPFVTKEEEEENDQPPNNSLWYGPADYARFEMDCRRSIQAAVRSRSADSPGTLEEEEEEEFLLQGLEDFLSYETRRLRSFRRLSHCYNVLYHQFIQRKHSNDDEEDDYDTMVSILQHISERSSRESLQLALCRGKIECASSE